MKAIIEIAKRGTALSAAHQQLADARAGSTVDYYLSFESARSLFAELSPARIDLLGCLRNLGPCSIYALAKSVARNYSNVHADVQQLENLGLVERDQAGNISVPFDAVEIRVRFAQAA